MQCGYLQWPREHLDSARRPQINEAMLRFPTANISWFGVTAECSLDCELPPLPTGNAPADTETGCALVSATFPYHIEARLRALNHPPTDVQPLRHITTHARAHARTHIHKHTGPGPHWSSGHSETDNHGGRLGVLRVGVGQRRFFSTDRTRGPRTVQ
jgi:hypothetical protein